MEGGALAMDIQGIREGALFAMHNMQDLSCEDETQRCIMVEIYLEP